MAPGIKRLQKTQIGKETTSGTAVPATTLWRGAGSTLDDQRVIEYVEEMVGIIDGADRTIIPKLLGGLELSETPLTFEQFPYLTAMAIGGPVTGAADGSGTDLIYLTNIPTTAKPTLKSYTIQGGDDFEVEQMEYAVCTKFSISGKAGEAVKMAATLMGRQVARISAFTGSLSIPSVEEALCSKGKVYLDAIGGSYGTTQLTNTILEFKLDFTFKWIPKFTMDGNLYFSYLVYGGHSVTGSLVFEHDTNVSGSGGAKADWRAQTPKLLRIDLIGNAVGTAGTTYTTKKCIVDLPIKYTKASPIGDRDGNDIVEMAFTSKYNTTAGNAGKFIVVNELSALP